MRWATPVLFVGMAALVAAWWWTTSVDRDDSIEPFEITEAGGTAARVRGGSSELAVPGMALAPQDRISTGADGHLVLSRGGGASVSLGAGARVHVRAVGEGVVELEVERGDDVRVRVRPDGGIVRLTSRDRALEAEDATFRAAVAADHTLAVRTEEGSVRVEGVEGVTSVGAGEEMVAVEGVAGVLTAVPDDLLLDVAWPGEVRVEELVVVGTTHPGAAVVVRTSAGEVTARADGAGRFHVQTTVEEGESEVEVRVRTAFGEEIVRRGEVQRATPTRPLRVDVK